MTRALLAVLLLCACHDRAGDQRSEQAMAVALNDGPRPDFARAIAILRASRLPQPAKDLRGGMMVLQSRAVPNAVRSADTLVQGLALVERAALTRGEIGRAAPQQLRLVFERGIGTPPDRIAPDPAIARCWRALEGRWDGRRVVHAAGDPATCITLRRQRLPHLGR